MNYKESEKMFFIWLVSVIIFSVSISVLFNALLLKLILQNPILSVIGFFVVILIFTLGNFYEHLYHMDSGDFIKGRGNYPDNDDIEYNSDSAKTYNCLCEAIKVTEKLAKIKK